MKRPETLGLLHALLVLALACPAAAIAAGDSPADATAAGTTPPEPAGWYTGDIHVHRSCGNSPVSLSTIQSAMQSNDVTVGSILADMGNGEVQNPLTDLPKVTGQDDAISTSTRILHWDAEWHWDATYGQYPHHALGGHLVLLGLQHAEQIWGESTRPILDWAHAQGAIGGFAHFQYLDDGIPQTLSCCTPVEYPVEVALGNADFISEDVNGSDAAIHAYYRLLNCGFRPGFAAGSDYPCASTIGPMQTYARAGSSLTYRKWIDAIDQGHTVVSRTGHTQFLDLKLNGTGGPGDQVLLAAPGSIPVTVTWTVKSTSTMARTLELVQNGVVISSVSASASQKTPYTLTTNVTFPASGWLCARIMGANGHELHTAAAFVTVAGAPVRASVADAEFYVRWIDTMLLNTAPGGSWSGFFEDSLDAARARYQAARAVYQQIAAEAGGASVTTIFQPGDTPIDLDANDGQPIETGVRFRSAVDGVITGLRFYKGVSNTGVHVGHLWTNGGTPLAGATFSGESAYGWQQVDLPTPFAITADVTYVASVHSDGIYSADPTFFGTDYRNGPLRALADGADGPNGVFAYGASQFPTQSFQSSNYWVDVVFAPSDTTRPQISSAWPPDGSAGLSGVTAPRATFTEDMDSTTVGTATIVLRGPNNVVVPATVAYDPATRTATLTPSQSLALSTSYTASVLGGASGPCVRDLAGNAMAATVAWTFTTGSGSLGVDTGRPRSLSLAVHPNPVHGMLRLATETPDAHGATLELLDVSGRIVRHLKTPQAAGRWSVDWDTRDDAGAALPAGLYFARLRSGTESTSVRFTIAR